MEKLCPQNINRPDEIPLKKFNPAAGATVTKQLSDEFDAADETLSEILDGLIGQFQSTNAKFVSDYNNARIIVDTSASQASSNQPTPAATPKP